MTLPNACSISIFCAYKSKESLGASAAVTWCHDMTRYDVTSPPPHMQVNKLAVRAKYELSRSFDSWKNVFLRFNLFLLVRV